MELLRYFLNVPEAMVLQEKARSLDTSDIVMCLQIYFLNRKSKVGCFCDYTLKKHKNSLNKVFENKNDVSWEYGRSEDSNRICTLSGF